MTKAAKQYYLTLWSMYHSGWYQYIRHWGNEPLEKLEGVCFHAQAVSFQQLQWMIKDEEQQQHMLLSFCYYVCCWIGKTNWVQTTKIPRLCMFLPRVEITPQATSTPSQITRRKVALGAAPEAAHCGWKSQKKVSFNIASEASYVYILSGQKLIKNAQNGPFWRDFGNLKLAVKQCYQTGHF